MDEYLEQIGESILFEGIKSQDMASMLGCLNGKIRHFQKNEFILHSGDKVSEIGMVLKGSVQVIKEDFWGNRSIIAIVGPGGLFAEAFSCVGDVELPISAVAMEKTAVLMMDYKKIVTVCPSACAFHSRLIQNMVKMIAVKNMMLTQKLEHMSKKTTREKLLSYLQTERIRQGGQKFDIPFNRQELADYLGVDRSAMSSELGKMRDEGLLDFWKNHFEIRS